MGIRRYISEYFQANKAARETISLNEDQKVIAAQVPELAGMGSVEGMAYVMEQIQDWRQNCSQEDAMEFANRLAASNEAMNNANLQLPYWANLWVLRTYQKELDLDVPAVAPEVNIDE